MIKSWTGNVELEFPCGCRVVIGFEESALELDNNGWVEKVKVCSGHDKEEVRERVEENIWSVGEYLKRKSGSLFKACQEGSLKVDIPLEEFLKVVEVV